MSFLKKVADTFLSTEDDMDKEIRKKERGKARDKETEREEYKRLLKEEEEIQERNRKTMEAHEKWMEEYTRPQRERKARIEYLEEKFNPKPKKDEIIEQGKQNQINILKKIKELFPMVDIYFYENILKEGDYSGTLFNINMENMTYSEFIGYKLYREMDEVPSLTRMPLFNFSNYTPYDDWMTFLDELNPNIFMNNVNIEWKLLQLAKKDTSILIPPNSPPPLPKPPEKPTAPKRNSPKKSQSPPKPPEKPTVPKRNSPKKSQSPPKPHEKPTAPKRQSPKSPPKSPPRPPSKSPPKPPPLPSDPNYELEMAFRNLEKKSKSPPNQKKMTSYKNKDLTNTELENLFRK